MWNVSGATGDVEMRVFDRMRAQSVVLVQSRSHDQEGSWRLVASLGLRRRQVIALQKVFSVSLRAMEGEIFTSQRRDLSRIADQIASFAEAQAVSGIFSDFVIHDGVVVSNGKPGVS